jgi:hypothetical protein
MPEYDPWTLVIVYTLGGAATIILYEWAKDFLR